MNRHADAPTRVYPFSADLNLAGQRALADRLIFECACHLNSLLDVELLVSWAASETGSMAPPLTEASVAGHLFLAQVARRQSFVRTRQRLREG
jgi:hypothetical protein